MFETTEFEIAHSKWLKIQEQIQGKSYSVRDSGELKITEFICVPSLSSIKSVECPSPNSQACELSSPSLPRRNASVRFTVTVALAIKRTAWPMHWTAVSPSVDTSANTVNTSATVSGCPRAVMHITETRVANVGVADCRAVKVASTASFAKIAAISFLWQWKDVVHSWEGEILLFVCEVWVTVGV